MGDCHGGGGLVASLHSAVFAESDIESLVNRGLIGIVVIWQQGLLELAFIFKGSLKDGEEKECECQHSVRGTSVILVSQRFFQIVFSITILPIYLVIFFSVFVI